MKNEAELFFLSSLLSTIWIFIFRIIIYSQKKSVQILSNACLWFATMNMNNETSQDPGYLGLHCMIQSLCYLQAWVIKTGIWPENNAQSRFSDCCYCSALTGLNGLTACFTLWVHLGPYLKPLLTLSWSTSVYQKDFTPFFFFSFSCTGGNLKLLVQKARAVVKVV